MAIHHGQEFEEARRVRKRRSFFVRTALFVGLLSIFATFLLWIVLRSPVFHLERLTILGNNEVAEVDILSALRANISGSVLASFLGFDNILNWPSSLTGEIFASYPQIKSGLVAKDYAKRAVTVDIRERQRAGVWCFKTAEPPECYWFDGEGVLFKRFFSVEGNLIPSVNDYSQKNPGLRGRALKSEFMSNLISIFGVLKSAELSVAEAQLLDASLQEVHVLLHDAPRLIFSLRFPASNTLEVVQSLAAKPEFKKLEYIDFRVENRAYYK